VAPLAAKQVLDRVEDRAGMGLHGHAIDRPQDMKIQGGHQGHDRGARGLVAADLQAVALGADVVGLVDHPGGQPEDLMFEGMKYGAIERKFGGVYRGLLHGLAADEWDGGNFWDHGNGIKMLAKCWDGF